MFFTAKSEGFTQSTQSFKIRGFYKNKVLKALCKTLRTLGKTHHKA